MFLNNKKIMNEVNNKMYEIFKYNCVITTNGSQLGDSEANKCMYTPSDTSNAAPSPNEMRWENKQMEIFSHIN